jgi:hypothetical protein
VETQDNFAPYAPTENVLRILNKARAGSLRGTIDVPYLTQLGIEQSMAPRSVRALRFLGFIQDDGNPTSLLEQYIRASDEDAHALLKGAIERSYAMILRAVDPSTDTRAKVFNAFRTMKPQGQWERMVTLFLGLCRAAGMEVKEAPPTRSGRLDSPRETRAPSKRSRPRELASQDSEKMRWKVEGQGDARFFHDMIAEPGRRGQETLDPAVLAFLGKLRMISTAAELDAWYETLKPLFLYVLSTSPTPAPVQENEAEAKP